jgi:hypothetical protein
VHVFSQQCTCACRPLLKVGGEIHITLKMAPPYSEWDVNGIAQSASYVKWQVRPFDFAQFPGYKHQTTLADAKKLDTSSNGATGKVVTLVYRRMQSMHAQPQGAPGRGVDSTHASHGQRAGADDACTACDATPQELKHAQANTDGVFLMLGCASHCRLHHINELFLCSSTVQEGVA